VVSASDMIIFFIVLITRTIKDISLDLGPCVAQLVECITCFASQGTVLNGCDDIHKNIVLRE
jgi:hypothetical protein